MVERKPKAEKGAEKQIRVGIYCPEPIRNKYKAILAEQGKSIQEDMLEHIKKTVEGKK